MTDTALLTDSGEPASACGQALGRKGRETRRRIMEAGQALLATSSPVDLTAVAIAKAAGMASATFYLYFRDVQDMLLAISETVTADMIARFEATQLFRGPADVEADSHQFLAMLGEAWERHGVILHYRSMEADRGDPGFRKQRERWANVVLERLFDLFRHAPHIRAPLDEADAGAEALVIFTSMERLAAAVQREPKLRGVPDRIRAAQARILTRMLRPDQG